MTFSSGSHPSEWPLLLCSDRFPQASSSTKDDTATEEEQRRDAAAKPNLEEEQRRDVSSSSSSSVDVKDDELRRVLLKFCFPKDSGAKPRSQDQNSVFHDDTNVNVDVTDGSPRLLNPNRNRNRF